MICMYLVGFKKKLMYCKVKLIMLRKNDIFWFLLKEVWGGV